MSAMRIQDKVAETGLAFSNDMPGMDRAAIGHW